MTDDDRMTDDEQRLRADLQRTLVPPATPASLRSAVDAMAEAHLDGPALALRSWWEAFGMGARRLGPAAGVLAVVGLAVVGALILGARGDGDVAATPNPTLPAMIGPALPSPATTPTRLSGAGWIDATTVVAVLWDRPTFRVSEDGGQTWSEERALPDHPTDLGFDFTDATHGYSMWTEGGAEEAQALVVDLTDDGGRTWRKVTAGSLPASVGTDALGDVHFSDARRGVALGTLRAVATEGTGFGREIRCSGWSTDDGGATWTDVAGAPCLWLGVSWPTPTLGYLILPDREIWVTTDGGRTWGHGELPDPGAGVEIWAKTGVVTPTGSLRIIGGTVRSGGDAEPPLVAWDSGDGGATWHESLRNAEVRMTDVQQVTAFDANHWLATATDHTAPLGGSVFRETFDGGRTWTDMGTVDIETGGGVSWADRLHGTMQGSRMPASGSGHGYITTWLTNDGGRTWHEVPF